MDKSVRLDIASPRSACNRHTGHTYMYRGQVEVKSKGSMGCYRYAQHKSAHRSDRGHVEVMSKGWGVTGMYSIKVYIGQVGVM